MKALLRRLTVATGAKMDLMTAARQEQLSLYTSYRLRIADATDGRVLILLVDESNYARGSSGSWYFQPSAELTIRQEIQKFCVEESAEPFTAVYIPPRMVPAE
jgi:hypothetical protein